MATQNLELKIRVDASQAQPVFNQVVDGLKALGIQHERIYKAIDVDTNKVIYDVKVLDSSVKVLQNTYYQLGDSIKKIVSQNLGMEDVSKVLSISSKDITETKNSIAELAQINKDRLEFALKQETEATRLRLAAKKADTIAAYAELEGLEKRHQESIRAITEFENLAEAASDRRRIEAKRKDTIAAFEELAVKEKEQADLVKFHLQANYNSRKVMYAALMREMDEADAARVAKEKARAPQAGRDDRGYTPFAMGTVGGNRTAAEAPKLDRQQTLQEAETRAFLARRARAEKEWADSFNAVVTPAVEKNTEAFKKNKDAVEQVGRAHKSMFAHIAEIVGIYSVLNTTISLVKEGLAAIPQAGIAMQQTTSTLSALFGSIKAEENIKFIKELANSAGQSFSDLAEAYRKFAPSAALAGATQDDVNQVFKDFTEASTVLHLGTDQVKSLYLALEQMYAKTTVQSEEIKKQLGNVLPGAVEVGAKAWENYINKGKEGAARTKLSVAEFMEAMSKNLVTSKNFIPEFAKVYKELFGGADDSVFADARTKLLSNLQRIKNELFYIASDMFDITSETMNKAAKLGADLITSVRQNLESVLQVVTALTTMIGVNLVASIAKFVVSVEGITKIGLVLGRVFNPLTLSITGAVAGLGTLMEATTTAQVKYEKFTAASKEQIAGLMATYAAQKEGAQEAGMELERLTEKSKSFSIDYEGIQISFSSLFEGLTTMFSEWWDEELARTARDWEKIKTLASNAWNSIGDYIKKILPYSTRESLSEMKGYFVDFALWINANIIKPIAEDLGITFDVILKKAKAAQEKSNAEIQAQKPIMFADPNLVTGDSNTPNKPDKQKDSALKQAAAERKRVATEAYKTALEEAKNASKQIQADISEALGNIDTLYKSNLLTIKDYFSQKKQLILTDAAVERQGIEARLQLAFAQKDRVAIEKLQGELIKSRTEETKNSTKAIQEETAALKARQDMLAGIQSEYARTFGTTIPAADAIEAANRKFLAANGDKIKQLELEVKAGDKVAEVRLKELKALQDNFVIQEQLTDLETKRNELVTEYEATLQRINNQLQSGTLSPLEAGYMSDEAKDRLTTNLEALKAKQQEVLTSQGTGIKLSDRIKREVEKSNNYLEDLKATGSRVGEGFKTVFSNSVTSAFTSFAMGTATAKQAFQSFAVSIVQGIAQIIAQEIALKAIKGVMSMFSMSFGGPVSGTVAATMGTGALSTAANGGVFSGAGISAYSGSVVDKPTIFPFANGIGLMGEAGAEAILPLKRNSQGKLGVATESSGQSNSNVYNIAVTVQSSKDEKPSDTGQKIAEAMMRTIAKQEIGNAARLGNSLNRTTKFG